MASQYDLCGLTDVKAWLGLTNTNSDAMLSGIISAVSQTILQTLNRSIYPTTRSERRGGTNTEKFTLSEWPVLSVSSLSVDGTAIPASINPPLDDGYVIEWVDPGPPGRMQNLVLTRRKFWRGVQNVAVTYLAGYAVMGEAAIVPTSPYQVTAAQPFGNCAGDLGVTYANGTALVKVTGAPSAGQYSVNASSGVYTFAAADAGQAVLISYAYVPAALREAGIVAVSDEFKAKDRIGIQSKSLAGQETITYTSNMLTARVKAMITPYMRVAQP